MENNHNETLVNYPKKDAQDIKAYIHALTKEELEDLVYAYAKKDEACKTRIMIKAGDDFDFNLKVRLQQAFIALLEQWEEELEDYEDCSDFSDNLKQLFDFYIPSLLEKSYYLQAYDFLDFAINWLLTFEEETGYEIDDFMVETCYNEYEEVITACDEEAKECLYQWTRAHKQTDNDIRNFIYQNLLRQVFEDIDAINERIAELDHMIQHNTRVKDRWVEERIFLMRKRKDNIEDILAYMQENRDIVNVRKDQIQEVIALGRVEKAIDLLKESKQESDDPSLIKVWSEHLAWLYHSEHRMQDYKDELLYQVTHCEQDNLVFINKLKEVCDEEEWTTIINQMKDVQPVSIMLAVYKQAKRYEDMMPILTRSSIFTMDLYADDLAKQYPDEIIDYYIQNMKDGMKCATKRKEYATITAYFKKIENIPGAKEKLQALANEWRELYPSKRALHDELKKMNY